MHIYIYIYIYIYILKLLLIPRDIQYLPHMSDLYMLMTVNASCWNPCHSKCSASSSFTVNNLLYS